MSFKKILLGSFFVLGQLQALELGLLAGPGLDLSRSTDVLSFTAYSGFSLFKSKDRNISLAIPATVFIGTEDSRSNDRGTFGVFVTPSIEYAIAVSKRLDLIPSFGIGLGYQRMNDVFRFLGSSFDANVLLLAMVPSLQLRIKLMDRLHVRAVPASLMYSPVQFSGDFGLFPIGEQVVNYQAMLGVTYQFN